MSRPAFTGYRRAHKTRAGVRIAEAASKSIITIGGIGVIAAVFLVFVFLASVVVPLVGRSRLDAAVSRSGSGQAPAVPAAVDRFVLVDEFRVAAAELVDGGRTLRHFRIDPGAPDGMALGELPLFGERPTSLSYSDDGGALAAGFADGTFRLGQVLFETSFFEDEDVPAELHALGEGEVGVLDGASIQRTPIGQLRLQRLVAHIQDPVASGHAGAVLLIDQTVRSVGPVVAMVSDDGVLRVTAVTRRRNILTGRVTATVRGGSAAIPDFGRAVPLARVLVSGNADAVYVLWQDGAFVRFDTRNLREPAVAERGDLLRDDAVRLTVARFLLGRDTVLIGDSRGRVRTWFRVRDEDAATADGLLLVNAHTFDGPAVSGGPAAVTGIASSSRKRMIAVGYDDGSVRSFYVTSNAFLAEARPFAGVPITAVALSPRDDALAAVTDRGFALLALDSPHPEATLGSIFTRVWYEGNRDPEPRLAVVERHRHVRGQVRAGAADLRNHQGDRLLDAVRRAAGAAGGHLHQRVPARQAARAPQADHRDDGQPAERRARLPGRPGVRAGGRAGGADDPGRVPDGPAHLPGRRLPVPDPARPHGDHPVALPPPLRAAGGAAARPAGVGAGRAGGRARAVRRRHQAVAGRPDRHRRRRLGDDAAAAHRAGSRSGSWRARWHPGCACCTGTCRPGRWRCWRS